MSEFDKEAERKKLEERFAEEEEDRETTERMSELLLQGATMTDVHCDECGNPLFRYDGQTFCSSCQRTVERSEGTGNAAATENTAAGNTATEPAAEPTNATQETTTRSAADQQVPATDPHDGSADVGRGSPTGTAAGRNEPSEPVSAPDQRQRAPADGTPTNGATAGMEGSGTADGLAATEASLSRTLRRQADAAERAEDLGRTRNHLAAVREAAEALDAVRSVR
ncbi:Sjogren's syndrome/scleroderma autoantigen 1 family protein [Halococcus hamelinensis]|uniref:Sjogrens syndrome scleroderma autoantigen 1 n=2 Tax=Halococcus hamelinensis TaxID=332168 RepID=M0M6X7_9EURY|nr:Sjogren's syndrome/scleroderma autoantigen 1 family protein [Halococcus hamelinensis]EMA40125.1 hypothetical protein C447_04862 [Halococcus hamelinensis 100A6]